MNDQDDQTVKGKKEHNVAVLIFLIILASLIFAITLLIYFFYFHPTALHNIEVQNNNSQDIVVIFGALSKSGVIEQFSPLPLAAGQKMTFQATPGSYMVVEAFLKGDTYGFSNPFTQVILQLAGVGYQGSGEISNGSNVLINVANKGGSVDLYNISLKKGFNISASIVPLSGSSNIEVKTIGNITPDQCPTILAGVFPGATGNYQWCATPCFADPTSQSCCNNSTTCYPPSSGTGPVLITTIVGLTGNTGITGMTGLTGDVTSYCQQSWISAYTVFYNACPQCQITNCDNFFYQNSQVDNQLTSYRITFS